MNLSKITRATILSGFIFIASCNACKDLMPIDPSATLQEKWPRISAWVSDASPYIVIADIKRLSATEFFKTVFVKNEDKSLLVFKAFGVENESGIMAFSGGLFYIGGKFDPDIVVARVKDAVGRDGSKMTEEKYRGVVVYTAEDDPNSSFAFLNKSLLVMGKKDEINRLILEKGRIKPPPVNTDHVLWGRLNNASQYYSKIDSLEFFSDVSQSMKLYAKALLPTKESAKTLAEEIEGFKTIKTIQSIDEPWLADVLDSTKIERSENEVNFSIALDTKTAKEILKRALQ